MKQKPEFRIETDLLGEVEIPSAVYWGIRTARANLEVSGLPAHSRIIQALVILKRCTVDLSRATSNKNREVKEAILSSCDEILEGKLQSHFIADPYYCDADEAINANINEVIANRAEELLGGDLGSYARVNPDEDVDLWPAPLEMELRSAARVALLLGFKDLEPAILDLERWFRKKSLECEQIIRSSDTGPAATLWRSLGPALNAYGMAIERCHRRLQESAAGLQEIGEAKEKELIDSVSKATSIPLRVSEEKSPPSQSMSEFLQFSSALKELSIELSSIAKNMRSSCSKFSQPFRSQENKRNGNSSETDMFKHTSDFLALITCQVTANDYAITQSCSQEAESIPFAANSLLHSLDLLRSALSHLNLKCMDTQTRIVE
jgi:aspartate ammonia-lyase